LLRRGGRKHVRFAIAVAPQLLSGGGRTVCEVISPSRCSQSRTSSTTERAGMSALNIAGRTRPTEASRLIRLSAPRTLQIVPMGDNRISMDCPNPQCHSGETSEEDHFPDGDGTFDDKDSPPPMQVACDLSHELNSPVIAGEARLHAAMNWGTIMFGAKQ
jgi:hypothetical protein